MRWLALLLWDPARALDWYADRHPSKLDHGKVGSDLCVLAILTVTLVVCLRTSLFPPVGIVLACVAAAFGGRYFMALLRSRAVTSEEHLTSEPPIQRPVDDPDAGDAHRVAQ